MGRIPDEQASHFVSNRCPCLKYVKERGERWGVFIISSHFSAPSSLLNAPSHAKVTSFPSLFFKKSSFFFSRGLLLATYWIRMAGMPPVRLFLSIDSYYPLMSNIPTCSFLLLQNIDSAPRPTDNPNIPTDDRFLRQSPAWIYTAHTSDEKHRHWAQCQTYHTPSIHIRAPTV